MKIEKPIFILGSGRSGTTLLYNLLALHPEVCWFSNLTNRYPRIRFLPMLHRMLDASLIGTLMKRQVINRTFPSLRPAEGEYIYLNHCGFEQARKMTAHDLTERMESRFKRIVLDHLKFAGKKRFLSKRTSNTQRIEVINRMFSDAYYVHLIRDGRAVANSLMNVNWWNDVDIWWLGYKPAGWRERGKEPIELCARHWKQDVQEIQRNGNLFSDRYLEITYEELVNDTQGSLQRIAYFCELNESDEYERLLPKRLRNMNYKWKLQLTGTQKQILDATIGSFMKELNYSSHTSEPGIR